MIIISDAEPSDISDDDQQMCSSPKRLRSDSDTVWMCTEKCVLHVQYKDIILQGLRLTDKHMNATQKLLKRQLTFIQGLHTTLKVTIESHSAWIPDSLQIFCTRGDHWITLTIMECRENNISIFDSLHDDFDTVTKTAAKMTFPGSIHVTKCLSA